MTPCLWLWASWSNKDNRDPVIGNTVLRLALMTSMAYFYLRGGHYFFALQVVVLGWDAFRHLGLEDV